MRDADLYPQTKMFPGFQTQGVGYLILLALWMSVFASCQSSHITAGNYERVQNGMTLTQVEAILGPGQRVAPDAVPTMPNGKRVIEGEELLRWGDDRTSVVIILAFSGGKISARYYWEPSL